MIVKGRLEVRDMVTLLVLMEVERVLRRLVVVLFRLVDRLRPSSQPRVGV